MSRVSTTRPSLDKVLEIIREALKMRYIEADVEIFEAGMEVSVCNIDFDFEELQEIERRIRELCGNNYSVKMSLSVKNNVAVRLKIEILRVFDEE